MEETRELTVVPEQKPLTAKEIMANVQSIQQVMKDVMKDKVHYGVISGTNKKTLYKAGSEKILATFHIAVDPEVIDLGTDDNIRYRVKCAGVLPSGQIVGYGVGEASTDEEKYMWRKAVCDEEYEDTPEDRRRIKYGKYNYEIQKTKQIRTNPADLANTVLKMAKKRAQIDLTLTATAASDVFDQDLEDIPEEIRKGMVGEEGKPTAPDPEPAALKESIKDKINAILNTLADKYEVAPDDALRQCSEFEGSNGPVFMTHASYNKMNENDPKKAKWLGSTLDKMREELANLEEN